VSGRSIARAAALAATLAAALWAAVLIFVGGFDVPLFGRTFSSHQPMRPILWGSAALAVFVLTNGVERTARAWTRVINLFNHTLVAVAIASAAFIVGAAYATTVANASDAYGYVSQADLWLRGDLRVPQPWAVEPPWPRAEWTFAPLAYRPVEAPDPPALVPVYSPGLPLMMAAAKSLGGHSAMFLVVPIAGAIMTLATYGIGRRLGSSGAGVIAAWFVLASPAFLYMLALPMTDVPVAAFWTLAFYFVLIPGVGGGIGAGAAAAVAILVRPNLMWLAGILGAWLVWQLRAPGDGAASPSPRARLWRLIIFATLVVASVAAIGVIFNHLYGSPFRTGYGELGPAFSWSHVSINLRNYTQWLIGAQTPLIVAGIVALAVPLRRVWPGVRDRRIFWIAGAFILALWLFYAFYLPFDAWWFLRFLLASWPFMLLGLAATLLAVARATGSIGVILVTWTVVVLGAYTFDVGRSRGAFELWRADQAYVAAARVTRSLAAGNSVVFSGLHSGSLRYYGGVMTIRYTLLDKDWLDRAVAWLAAHGVPSYALLELEEIQDFRKQFASQSVAQRLDDKSAAALSDTARLFTLAAPVEAPRRPPLDMGSLRAAPPVDLPRLVYR
jgi:4-amino-4-deoxy-L-arabinose transferase-like glycosyltransferase